MNSSPSAPKKMMRSTAIKKIGHHGLNLLTYVFVLVNLVPILWMVWCGFKDNNEILLGKVMPGLRDNSFMFMDRTDDGSLVTVGRDGSLTVFSREDLSVRRSKNLGTFATSVVRDDNALWIMSANKGLVKVDISTLKVLRKVPMSTFKKSYVGEWGPLWVNDITRSTVFKNGDKIYAALLHENFPGLACFDERDGKVSFVAEDLRKRVGSINTVCPLDRSRIAVASERGISVYNNDNGTIERSWPSGRILPFESPIDLFAMDSTQLLAVLPSAVVGLSALSDSSRFSVKTDVLPGKSSISTACVNGGALWVGNSNGATGFTFSNINDPIAAVTPTFRSESRGESDLTGSQVHALMAIDRTLYLGGPQGAISAVNIADRHASTLQGAAPKAPYYIHWRNYIDMWRNIKFGVYLKNSLIICVSVMLISMLIASLAGYALARYHFRGKDTIGYSILATQMIPGIMLLIPVYLMFVNFTNITSVIVKDTFVGVILMYAGFFTPASIWIMRGFFAAIPKDLEEAGIMDGCTPFQAFFKVILPVALPGLVATGVYTFLLAWDELMFAWVLTGETTATIPVGIRLFVGNFQNRYDLTMAAATMATLPVMILFFIMQRQIVSGLTAGAVKE